MVKALREASSILNPIDVTNSIFRQSYLNFKYIFTSINNSIVLFVFPLIMLALPIFFIPLRYSFGVYMFISCVIPSGIIYISLGFEWRRSTLFINQKITKGNRIKLYSSLLLTMLILTTILIFESFLLLIIFKSLFSTIWLSSPNGLEEYYILRTHIVGVFYLIYLSTAIMFTLLYFCQSLINNKKSMYIILLSIIIIDILFGGALNGYFNATKNKCFFLDKHTVEEVVAMPKIERKVATFFGEGSALFPTYLYWPTAIFFPFFGPTQQLSSIGATSLIWDINDDGIFNIGGYKEFVFWYWASPKSLGLIPGKIPLTNEMYIKWNSLWIIPYVWMFALGGMGLLISSYTKK